MLSNSAKYKNCAILMVPNIEVVKVQDDHLKLSKKAGG